MQISPISFGKIFKVNAPCHIAGKLADMANEEEETQVAKDLRNLFEGQPVATYKDTYGKCWLLSGIDKKYNDSEYNRYTALGCTIEDYETYRKIMNKYLHNNADGIITVAHDGQSPKAIDVIS